MADIARLVAAGMTPRLAYLLGGGTPGEFKFYERLTAPEGWLPATGDTIGKPGSNATYAGEIYYDLFCNRWTMASNTSAPIQNADGTTGIRGASANDDWFALKQLPLPDLRGVSPIGLTPSGATSQAGARGGTVDLRVRAHYHGMGAGSTLSASSAGASTTGNSVANITANGMGQSAAGNQNYVMRAGTTGGANNTGLINDPGHTHTTPNHTHPVSGSIGLVTSGVDGNANQSLVDASGNAATTPFYAGLWCIAY